METEFSNDVASEHLLADLVVTGVIVTTLLSDIVLDNFDQCLFEVQGVNDSVANGEVCGPVMFQCSPDSFNGVER